ncbi:MAG: site-specific DNA-methyltransferase [Planctomycetes bacterium]|nr:site-specific DNA-methyltransferase [Planctomycetota bacterium]
MDEGTELYRTEWGRMIVGAAEHVLSELPSESVDLVVTSPPFALLRQKSYGNLEQSAYVDWLVSFGPLVQRVLKTTGSFVLDLGGAYQRGKPVRSLYNYRVLLQLCDKNGFHLAEEFFWHNPSKLPSPIEWVNKRKVRAKDSVNTVWWLSKSENPKADISKVLTPYSKRMKKLLGAPERFYTPKDRPSGHDISDAFGRDNGGAIPSNLLQYSNTESNSVYIRLCKELGFDAHPARFPKALPSFFINFLTEPGDLVLDIFCGSNTTGEAAEELGRKWIGIELSREYAITSAFRFMSEWHSDQIGEYVETARSGDNAISVLAPQRVLF